MPRSVNSVAKRARRKKILKQAKGYFGRRKNVYTVAKNAVEKAMSYAYRDRKNNKRNDSMKICLVNNLYKDYKKGGAEIITEQLATMDPPPNAIVNTGTFKAFALATIPLIS